MNIQLEINKLLKYGLKNGMIKNEDFYYSANKIIQLLKLKEFIEMKVDNDVNFYQVMDSILNFAFDTGLIDSNTVVYRDLFDSQLMDCLMPRPSEVNQTFWNYYNENPKKATEYYYELSQRSNYIRVDRTSKNILWKSNTNYGELDITINLSKPEKDPKAIAEALKLPKTSFPKCLLCRENEGYSGHLNHPGRHNHRLIELELNDEKWFLQYSPYVYYNEHSIILRDEHVPMKITRDTFKRLLDFVCQFKHYFIGSNADLPIVGGSILSHDHFQGGNYEFAMMKQGYKVNFKLKGYEDVEAGIVNWPMSVIRLRSTNPIELINISEHILIKWREYSDLSIDILSHSDDVPHNTITPIARYTDGKFEMNLVLRNNRTTEEHPLGIFHPHKEHQHIKKENIGLIEVMGLAVLPARLIEEISLLKDYLLNETEIIHIDDMIKHKPWIDEIKPKYSKFSSDMIDYIFEKEIGIKFQEILSQCGVFKDIEPFMNFINSL